LLLGVPRFFLPCRAGAAIWRRRGACRGGVAGAAAAPALPFTRSLPAQRCLFHAALPHHAHAAAARIAPHHRCAVALVGVSGSFSSPSNIPITYTMPCVCCHWRCPLFFSNRFALCAWLEKAAAAWRWTAGWHAAPGTLYSDSAYELCCCLFSHSVAYRMESAGAGRVAVHAVRLSGPLFLLMSPICRTAGPLFCSFPASRRCSPRLRFPDACPTATGTACTINARHSLAAPAPSLHYRCDFAAPAMVFLYSRPSASPSLLGRDGTPASAAALRLPATAHTPGRRAGTFLALPSFHYLQRRWYFDLPCWFVCACSNTRRHPAGELLACGLSPPLVLAVVLLPLASCPAAFAAWRCGRRCRLAAVALRWLRCAALRTARTSSGVGVG